ncbi:hypothetical protein CRM22_006232, partial [Opisthorchis felineus]
NTTCAVTYDLPASIIESPGFPLGYSDKLNMTWRVSQPEGCTIRMQFEFFK